MLIDETEAARRLAREYATIRVARGISQDAIAEAIGTTQGAVGAVENCVRIAKLTTFLALLRPLGLTLAIVEDVEAGDA